MKRTYKRNVVNVIFCMLFLVIVFLLIGKVYSAKDDDNKFYTIKQKDDANPTETIELRSEDSFLKISASDLLGKTIHQGFADDGNYCLWRNLSLLNQHTCLYHKKAYEGIKGAMNSRVSVVYDIKFDSDKGVMKIESRKNILKNNMTETGYKEDWVDNSNGAAIGELAANVTIAGNNAGMRKKLMKLVKSGANVVYAAGLLNNYNDFAGEGVANGEKEVNPGNGSIENYTNYKKIVNAKTKAKAKEREIVTINNKQYRVIGPLKMNFGYKGIEEVTVANASWEKGGTSKQIYWRQQKEKIDGRWTYTNWSTDFNKKSDGKFQLSANNRAFYLAVRMDKLIDTQYKIIIKQEKFKYKNARIIVCMGSKQQQAGLYAFDKDSHSVNGKIQWTIKSELASLIVDKKDSDTKESLNDTDVRFKLYASCEDQTRGWVYGGVASSKEYNMSAMNATEYEADTLITDLKRGTYYIWESHAPSGYDITEQKGYNEDYKMALLGQIVINSSQEYTIPVENKRFIEIEGNVWSNEPDTKNNTIETKLVPTSDLLQGIKVNLYDGVQSTPIATTTTDGDGHYIFTTKNLYTGADKNIYYTDLAKAYVEFIYDNKEYVTVEPSTGNETNTSKAQEYDTTVAKLDDNKLTGTTGENPGKAVTNRQKGLTGYFDSTKFKVSNVNLGLMRKHTPEFSVNETLAYIKVNMNGYTYTYKYGDAPVTTSSYVPTVNEQTSAKTFTGKIYPTDIAYNIVTETSALNVYAIYRIDVTNSESVNIDNLYKEQMLYLKSLTTSYDQNRYELCTNENNSDKSDFGLWEKDGEGNAKYNINSENSSFKKGISSGQTSKAYIQFKVQQGALKQILENNIDDKDLKQAPSIATAEGYHEYIRTDNLWVHSNNISAFEGSKATIDYLLPRHESKKYYVHKSIENKYSSGALYLRLTLGESRKISGTVFEDNQTSKSQEEGTILGNGIYNNGENQVKDVKVELLESDKKTVAKLYKKNDREGVKSRLAETTSIINGVYQFDGVVPGHYYVRFTYGDGTQQIVGEYNKDNGVPVYINEYKSTIINTNENGNKIKNAIDFWENNTYRDFENLSEQQKKEIGQWYNNLNDKYSTAIDDMDKRHKSDEYIYTSDKGTKKGDEEVELLKEMNAYTPMVSIPIENDIEDSTNVQKREKENEKTVYTEPEGVQKFEYNGFNFGIIKQGITEIDVNKEIKNIRVTTQTGTNLVSASPDDKEAKYITALDRLCKKAKMEIENNLAYGSELAVTYQVTLTNNSTLDYSNDDYFKYGIKGNEKRVTIKEVKDQIDSRYDFNKEEFDETVGGSTKNGQIKVQKVKEGNNKYLFMTEWTPIKKGESTSVTYTANTLLSSNSLPTYTNNVSLTKISLDKLTCLQRLFKWKQDETYFSITAPTGKDKSNKYIIAAGISLSALAIGILTIKRKVLKK